MTHVLVINTAEPDDRRFCGPIVNRLQAIGALPGLCDYANQPESKAPYAGVVLSASPRGDNGNFSDRLRAFEWLKTTDLPVLGICAGLQLIGVTFGAELICGQTSEQGFLPVQLKAPDPLFLGYDTAFNVQQNHNDGITLPPDFVTIASSDKCPVQAMRHREKLIWGVQWHAEISNLDLIDRFVSLITTEQMDPTTSFTAGQAM